MTLPSASPSEHADDVGNRKPHRRGTLKRLEGLMNLNPTPPVWLTDIAAHLRSTVPAESGDAIVHNDFRLGNVIWSDTSPPTLLAILDWELATIGDPLLDLGYAVCCYPMPGEELNPTQELSAAMLADGFPSRDAFVARYAETTGRDVSKLPWYAAMAAWKLAVLYEYQHRLARDAYYEDATQAPRFIATAERFARGI